MILFKLSVYTFNSKNLLSQSCFKSTNRLSIFAPYGRLCNLRVSNPGKKDCIL